MSEKYLEIKNLRKHFGDLEVLKDISLSVSKGEVVSIIGPSGSGKSTLLRCATLLETMDGGSLYYMDKPVCTDSGHGSHYVSKKELSEARRNFGLVFQNFNLFPHYSVLKNVMDALVVADHIPAPKARETAMDFLGKLGLAEKADAYPYQLSGGQQQRVSIARALSRNPRILYFDEPTSALDPELTGEVLKVIKDLASQHMTMIIVTHEMNFAKEVSDRIIFMEGGLIVQEGSPNELFENPVERVREFIGRLGQPV